MSRSIPVDPVVPGPHLAVAECGRHRLHPRDALGSGDLETIDFLASTVGGYSIDAESQCADGDYGEMTGSGSTS
ncbi:hypothetical protein [Curtobacterium flaccumfaciens]|uniref:hypothetical protein n=1 Tax=Curtobacterium flaccumfaciens TaxID=2035 RepID=UPI00387A6A77